MDADKLKWFAEAERIHARWAMLAVAGIMVQVRTVALQPIAGRTAVYWTVCDFTGTSG